MTKIKKETPNTKHQKITHIRCFKCQNIWLEWKIQSQIWKHTDRNCKIFMIFFSHFSLISHFSVKSLPLFFSKDDPLLSQPLIFSSLILTAFPLFLSASLCHRSFSWSGFFIFIFLVIWYVGSVMGGFRWGWLGLALTVVGGLGCRWIQVG